MGAGNLIPIPAEGDWAAVRKAIQVLAARLGPGGSPHFAGLDVDSLSVDSLTVPGLSGVVKAVAGVIGGDAALDDLSDVDATSPTKNYVLKWDGTNWVPAVYDASFVFTIAAFSDAQSSPQEIGAAGVWKAIGALSFTATYNNGPPDATPYVSMAGAGNAWADDLDMTTSPAFEGPTTNAEAVNYPAAIGSITFTLHAASGAESDTEVQSVAFYNRRHWGVSAETTFDDSADIAALADDELSNSKGKTFTVTAGAGEYIWYCYPARLGTSTFWVGGFEGGFGAPNTVSRTNASGFIEDYYCYRSTNANLGETTVTVV